MALSITGRPTAFGGSFVDPEAPGLWITIGFHDAARSERRHLKERW